MTYGREALLALRVDSGPRAGRTVKRIPFFVGDSRDLREKRDWSTSPARRATRPSMGLRTLSWSKGASPATWSHISRTSCARRDRRYERLAHSQAGR